MDAPFLISRTDGGKLEEDLYYTDEPHEFEIKPKILMSAKIYQKDTNNERIVMGTSCPDLNTSIQIMSLFPIQERSTREETEPFFHLPQSILDQMVASNISESIRV